MKRVFLLSIAAVMFCGSLEAQYAVRSYEGYFRVPMDVTLLPSANFAETRPNHFHSGVDIKTGGAEGKAVYAAADGFVSRMAVSHTGFGRALYINHPNGTTTVYAHLQKFVPAMEKYATDERYAQKKHRVDLYLDAKTFSVKQGDLIGYSGNSGSSGGPHLHYEAREAATQSPINPITHGVLRMKDDIPPTIVRLHYIEVDTVRGVPVNSKPRAVEIARLSPGVYAPADAAPLVVGERGYFVLEVTDRKNDTQNTMGVYRVAARLDGAALFGFALDGFSYSDTKYVNSLCHYKMQKGSRNQLIRLALQQNNRLPVYTKMRDRGLVVLRDTEVHLLDIEAEDDTGNASSLTLHIRRRAEGNRGASQSGELVAECSRDFNAQLEGLRVAIPAGALYEPIFYTQSSGAVAPKAAVYSPVYTVHTPDVPLHKNITVSIAADRLPARLRERACLAMVAADGSLSYAGGKYENGRVSGPSSVFGNFCIAADTIPPTVTASFAEGEDLRGKKTISFTLKDNFSGVSSYEATIDGRWILFERKSPSAPLVHTFDPSRVDYAGGKHELVMTATDGRGNTTSLKRSFVR